MKAVLEVGLAWCEGRLSGGSFRFGVLLAGWLCGMTMASLLVAVCPDVSAAEGAGRWRAVGLAGGGAMFAISGSPHDRNLMMLSSDMSGAFLSRDGGRGWDLIHHAQLGGNIGCAALFDPDRAGTIYAAAGRLKVSTDSGRTWEPVGGSVPWRREPGMLYKDGESFFVGCEDGLWLSRDGLLTWRSCEGIEGTPMGLCADRRTSEAYVVGTEKGVFRSEDGGRTFRRMGKTLPLGRISGFAGGSDGRETRLYVAVECSVAKGELVGGIYASSDGGITWRSVMNADLNRQTSRRSEWANGEIAQYRFLLTTDRQPRRVYVYCPGTSYYPPDHNTIYRSDDGGGHWRAVFYSDPRFKGQYNVEDDRLTLAIHQRYQSVPYSVAINPADPDVLMMTTDQFVYLTADGGASWQVSQSRDPVSTSAGHAWACNGLGVTTAWNYYIDPFERGRHYICYTDIGLARSLDVGRTWLWDGHRIPWHNTTYELAFDPGVEGRVWGAFSETHDIPNGNIISGRHRIIPSGGVAVSEDHGGTWRKLDLPEAPCVSVVVDARSPKERRTLYASLFERGVYKSTDGGRHWALKNRGLGSRANLRVCRLILHEDGVLFCLVTARKLADGTYEKDGAGLYCSTDAGETWRKISGGLSLLWPKDFAVDPFDSNHILMGAGCLKGHDQGGLYGTTDGGATWRLVVRKGDEHFGATFHPARRGWVYLTLCEGASESALYLSRDHGQTWAPFTDLPFANIMRVAFDSSATNEIILSTFGASVLRGPAVP